MLRHRLRFYQFNTHIYIYNIDNALLNKVNWVLKSRLAGYRQVSTSYGTPHFRPNKLVAEKKSFLATNPFVWNKKRPFPSEISIATLTQSIIYISLLSLSLSIQLFSLKLAHIQPWPDRTVRYCSRIPLPGNRAAYSIPASILFANCYLVLALILWQIFQTLVTTCLAVPRNTFQCIAPLPKLTWHENATKPFSCKTVR